MFSVTVVWIFSGYVLNLMIFHYCATPQTDECLNTHPYTHLSLGSSRTTSSFGLRHKQKAEAQMIKMWSLQACLRRASRWIQKQLIADFRLGENNDFCFYRFSSLHFRSNTFWYQLVFTLMLFRIQENCKAAETVTSLEFFYPLVILSLCLMLETVRIPVSADHLGAGMFYQRGPHGAKPLVIHISFMVRVAMTFAFSKGNA